MSNVGKGVFHVGSHVAKNVEVSANLEVEEFLKAIDSAPREEISLVEAIRLSMKMAKLMKKAEKL